MAATRKSKQVNHTRFVGYVRISKDRDEQTSTASQEQALRAWAQLHNVELVEIVVEKGRSAYSESRRSRPGMARAMRLLESGAATGFVCWKIDRAVRNVRDFAEFLDELGENGWAFVSATQPFDTTDRFGRAMMMIVAVLAELESATKAERTEDWWNHRRHNGGTPGGQRPYGYRRERNALLVDETEADVIRRVAADVIDGRSLRAIIGELNDSGTFTKNDRPWDHRALRDVLMRPTIAALWDNADGEPIQSEAWEPIVDRATWDAVRAILDDPARRTNTWGSARRYLLTGFARCGQCGDGTTMRSHPHRTGIRYECKVCKMSVAAPNVDDVVETAILDNLNPKTWKRLRRRTRHVDTSGLEAELDELAQQRADGEITSSEWKIIREGIQRRIDEAQGEPVTLPDVDDIRKAWPELPVAARRLVVEAVVAGLTILPPKRGANRFDPARVVFDGWNL